MTEKPKRKRSTYLLIGMTVVTLVELTSYLLGRFGIWLNDIWVFATFIVLSLALLYIRQRTKERAELEILAIAYEHKKIEDDTT